MYNICINKIVPMDFIKNKTNWLLATLVVIGLLSAGFLYYKFSHRPNSPEETFKQALMNSLQTKQASLAFSVCSSNLVDSNCQPGAIVLEGFDFSENIYFLEATQSVERLFNPNDLATFQQFSEENKLKKIFISFKIYQPATKQNFINFQLKSEPIIDDLAGQLKDLGLINENQWQILEADWLPEIKDQVVDQTLNLENFMNPTNPILFGLIPDKERLKMAELIEEIYQTDYESVRQFTNKKDVDLYEYDVTVNHKQLKKLWESYAQQAGFENQTFELEDDIEIRLRLDIDKQQIISYDQKVDSERVLPTYLRRQVVGFGDNQPWSIQPAAGWEGQYFYQIIAKLYNISQAEAKLMVESNP